MKTTNLILGITFIALAIAIGVVPHFTDCQSQGLLSILANGNKVPMKCHWTGVAEMAVAIPLAGVGMMMVFSRRKQATGYLSLTAFILAGVALALPHALIGTCPTLTHTCNTLMKPALDGLGSLGLVAAATGLVLSVRTKETL
jgi:hypothetical protein